MITFGRETVAEVWPDVQEVAAEHWENSAKFPENGPRIVRETYEALEKANQLVAVVARKDGKLIGYVVFYLAPSAFYRDMTEARCHALFLSRAQRRGTVGYRLLKEANDVLASAGAGAVYYASPCGEHDFSPLLKRIGCEPLETTHVRKLK